MDAKGFLEAVKAGDRARAEAALDADPSLADARDETGVSAVLLALYHGHGEIAETLADRADALDVHALAALGRAEALAAKLDAAPQQVSAWSPDGFQPLHLAAFFGRVDALDALIARGAEVNATARHPAGMAPLHSAAASRNAAIVTRLLEAGADPDVVQAGGFTALMSAALHGDEAMADALLAAGADRSITADDGRSAADLAREGGHDGLAARLDPG